MREAWASRSLFISHGLVAFGNRLWQFATPLLLVAIFPSASWLAAARDAASAGSCLRAKAGKCISRLQYNRPQLHLLLLFGRYETYTKQDHVISSLRMITFILFLDVFQSITPT